MRLIRFLTKQSNVMKRYIIVAIAIAVTGCGIYKPYSRPEVSTDNLYGAELESCDTTTIADIEWHEFFTDAKLQALIERGLENNIDLQAAQLRIDEAEAALKSARLAYLPSFNLNPTGGVSSFAGSRGAWTYTAPLAASWQIDIFGGITNAKRKAKAAYAQSLEYRQAVRTRLIAEIANYYYTLLMLDSQFEVTALTAESLAGSAETMRSMMDAGMTNRAGVSQMEAAAFSAEASLYDIAYNIRNVENALCTLLGETPHVIDRSTLIEQVLPADINIGIPVQLLANRPDVRMAEYALMQAYYATAAARSALYPSLTLNGILGWTNDAGSAIINPGGLLLSAAASIAAPIFNGGKLRAQVKIAEAQQQEALLTFQQTLLNAGAEVNTLLAQVQTANSKMDIREQQINSLIMAVESTELLMQHGSTTYLEVLTAQQNLLTGRLSQISDCFERMQGMVNLYAALGGGREPIVDEDNKCDKRDNKRSKK